MPIRKFRGDKIFDGKRMLTDHVLITDAAGRVLDLLPRSEAGEAESYPGIIAPGFINCHCHLELSHMKGRIPEGTGLVDFVYKVVSERNFSTEEIGAEIKKAEEEMVRTGIVAVGDICNNDITLHQKKKANLDYYNFIEASGWLPSLATTRFERAKNIFDEYLDARSEGGEKYWQTSIVPHAPYSVSGGLWEAIRPFFKNKVVSIHNQETAFEDEFFLKGTGDFKRMYELMKIDNSHHLPTKKSSLQSYYHHLLNAASIILVHNTFIGQQDLDYIKSTGTKGKNPPTYFCLCVNANQYIEKALPPVEMLRDNGCSIVLGTDSLASNHSLNILDEIKTIRKHFPGLPVEEVLQWATLNGARALRMDEELGSFEKGKKPGIILMDENLTQSRRLL
jgi:cytosine/adenosine deaminase-related metal-dependent hydrolase